MSDLLQALSIEESVDLGIKPFISAETDYNHNPLVDSLLTGNNAPRYDARGHLVISYRQYQELHERNAMMSQYALEVTLPGKPNVRQLIPASKYLKFWGNGFEVVGAPIEETHAYADTLRRLRLRGMEQDEAIKTTKALIADRDRVATAPRALPVESNLPEDVTLFFCRDKYPDCKRVFDTSRGLQFHWRNEHGEAPIKKAAAPKVTEPSEEE